MFEREGHPAGSTARARRLRADMKPSEQRLWKELRKLDAHIRRQAPIGRFVTDFACHAKKLVIEVDGGVHERLENVALRDHERAEWLRSQGYKVVRFTNRQVDEDLYAVVDEIRRHLALPLDGEGLGWGARSDTRVESQEATAPHRASRPNTVLPPQSPTLSPSRGKGA